MLKQGQGDNSDLDGLLIFEMQFGLLLCIHVYICIYIYIFANKCVYMYTHSHIYIYTYPCKLGHVHDLVPGCRSKSNFRESSNKNVIAGLVKRAILL